MQFALRDFSITDPWTGRIHRRELTRQFSSLVFGIIEFRSSPWTRDGIIDFNFNFLTIKTVVLAVSAKLMVVAVVVLVSNVPRGKMFTRGRETSEKFNIGLLERMVRRKQPQNWNRRLYRDRIKPPQYNTREIFIVREYKSLFYPAAWVVVELRKLLTRSSRFSRQIHSLSSSPKSPRLAIHFFPRRRSKGKEEYRIPIIDFLINSSIGNEIRTRRSKSDTRSLARYI